MSFGKPEQTIAGPVKANCEQICFQTESTSQYGILARREQDRAYTAKLKESLKGQLRTKLIKLKFSHWALNIMTPMVFISPIYMQACTYFNHCLNILPFSCPRSCQFSNLYVYNNYAIYPVHVKATRPWPWKKKQLKVRVPS